VSVGAADAAMVIEAPWHAGFGLLLLGLCINIKPEACMYVSSSYQESLEIN
jgi:hypothetical protein